MADLTAIILTKNEEKNIGECIRSIQPVASRVVVVDSGSEDRTVEIAQELGAEILVHPFENYSRQFIYGMEHANIQTKWVLRIDADEQLTEESATELQEILEANDHTDVNGVVIRFEVIFMGKQLRHGGIYPFRKLLVFRYGKGFMEERNMDEHITLTEGRIVELKHDSKHKDYKDLTYWIHKHNWYSSREVLDYIAAQGGNRENGEALEKEASFKRFVKFHIYYKLPMGMRSYLYYFYRYYLKGGFLDGKEGKIFAFLQAYWYRFLVDAKIYEWQKQSETKDEIE
ncbi:MAG: glycosyltransferase family 2 protein [Lachnospiraceae bacterium]|nr:glycosyltransferase family 2 protein [Lachnospiraceae bacterium]